MKILVIRFSSLGDVVLLSGVLKYVKENLGEDVDIDLLTFSSFKDVFENFSYIRKVYHMKKGGSLADLNEVIFSMPEYDIIFDLHNNLRSFFVRLVSAGKHYVYNKDTIARRQFVKNRRNKSKLNKHVVEKYFMPFQEVFHLEMPPLEILRPYLLSINIEKTTFQKHIIIHPFASKKTKEWPLFSELAELLISEGHKVSFVGVGDINIPKEVVDKTGAIPLSSLIDYISKGDVFITTDSGPMHIAIALNIPTIAIFGPTTKELGFYPSFKNVKVIEYLGLKCRPCHIHGSNKCPEKHFKCMEDIGVEEVRYHIDRLINTFICHSE